MLGSARAGEPESGVDETRAALEKWVETRRAVSKERQDWTLARQTLRDRVDLVQREIETLREKIAATEGSIADADRKRAELVSKNDSLEAALSGLGGIVGVLETRTKDLLARLPDPIRERVKPVSQGIPEDPAATQIPLSTRFQNVVGVLNEVNRFSREVLVTSETRTLASGVTAEVTTLYLGIGQGYYVTKSGESAGVGRATPEGWTWSPMSEAAPEIARAISILKNEQVAQFVNLPILTDERGAK